MPAKKINVSLKQGLLDARKLAVRTKYAEDDKARAASSDQNTHPAARKKPKPTSMAPRKGGKRKHYGKPFGKKGGSS